MNGKLFRLVVALAAIVAALGASALAADASPPPRYCDPLAGCKPSHFVKVSPSSVKAGHAITLTGAVGKVCKKPAQVTIYSRAFKGAAKHEFAGVPAIFSRTNRKGKFSDKVTITKSIKPGRYSVGARCGRGNVGSTRLKVTKT